MLALSLFSGAGIGDIGFRAAGFKFVGFCELEGDRLDLAERNFPESHFFVGDIWANREEIVDYVRGECRRRNEPLKLISCTAPCQGMSKNGQGTLLKNIRDGKRPTLDPRNRLILPALWIINQLQPELVVFENVPEMRRTFIEDDLGHFKSILDVIEASLGSDYAGAAYDVEFADYGIPQRRQRLITVYSRLRVHRKLLGEGDTLIPDATHSRNPEHGKRPWVSVSEAIKEFPALDARSKQAAKCDVVPYHRVPVLDDLKYWWVSNTPPGRTAFDNQCIACGFQGNVSHANIRGLDGINQASKATPLHCMECGEMLPRPSVAVPDGSRRIMSGFTSAYKRMASDLPSPTLTRNFSYACSDQKLHPNQNRVLSIAEALKIHTLSDYDYRWEFRRGDVAVPASDALIRLVIGESIPPKFLEQLGKYLLNTASGDLSSVKRRPKQHALFESDD